MSQNLTEQSVVIKDDISLIECVKKGLINDVERLLKDSDVDVNAIDEHDKTSFIYALANGYKEIALCLLNSQKLNLDFNGPNEQTYLMLAIDLGYFDIAKQLIELGANTNSKDIDGKSALLVALENENFDIASLLLKNRADINVKNNAGWTLLIWASIKGYMKTVQFLLDRARSHFLGNNQNRLL